MNASFLSKASEQRANEPSMEEILASIRRIIADDRMLPLTQRANPSMRGETAPTSAPSPESSHPSELPPPPSSLGRSDPPTERASAIDQRSLRVLPGGIPMSEYPGFSSPSEQIEEEFFPQADGEAEALAVAATENFPESDEPAADEHQAAESDSIAPSAQTQAHESQPSFNDSPLLSEDADASVASSFQSLATTVFLQNTGLVEQSLRDLLRPLLKHWLDENLPAIVERLVRSEIERVARAGRQ